MRRNPRSDLCVYPESIDDLRSFAECAVRKELRSLVCCFPHGVSTEELDALREEYDEKLQILLACEGEMPKRELDEHFDLSIGEIRVLDLGGIIVPFPQTAEEVYAALRYTQGDIFAFLRKCYETLTTLQERTSCDAVRLFDAVSMWNKDGKLFDVRDYRYFEPEWKAIEALLRQNAVIELCVSPCKRGQLPIGYPTPQILRLIGKQCGRLTLSSRAHSAEEICRSFPEAIAQLRACGIGSVYIRQKDGWKQMSL